MVRIFKPERFAGGISGVYQGITDLFFRFKEGKDFNYEIDNSILYFSRILENALYFDSARSILYFLIKFYQDKGCKSVICCGYTCDAVTDTLFATGINIKIVDINPDTLEMNITEEILNTIDCRHIILIQNSFGLPGTNLDLIKKIKLKGAITIVDNSLSFGSEACIEILENSDLSFFSFEVSKSFTIGWCGGLIINNSDRNDIICKYELLKSKSVFLELRNYIQLYLCHTLQNKGNKFFIIIWFLLKIFGFIRKSGPEYLNNKKSSPKKIGILNSRLIKRLETLFPHYYKIAKKNTLLAINSAVDNKINIPAKYLESKSIITPRIPIFHNKNNNKIKIKMRELGYSDSIWFNNTPKYIMDNNLTIEKNINCFYEETLNIFCYINLGEPEIFKLIKIIKEND